MCVCGCGVVCLVCRSSIYLLWNAIDMPGCMGVRVVCNVCNIRSVRCISGRQSLRVSGGMSCVCRRTFECIYIVSISGYISA